MSLLMDALKRAENNKQQAGRTLTGNTSVEPDSPEELRLEPLGQPAAKPLPELASHLDELEADLTTVALSATPQRPGPLPQKPIESPKAEAEREAIRNAFAAKLVSEPPSRKPLWLALGTLTVAGLGIGTYVWFQLNSMGNSGLAASLTPASSSPPLATASSSTVTPTLPALPVKAATVFAPVATSTAASPPAPEKTALFAPPRRETLGASQAQRDNQTDGNASIRLTRSRPEPDANLARGHSHLQSNELDLAWHDFEQALQRDPNNTDALLALAAIAQRQGQLAVAEQLQQRAMIANPSDAAVQAASLNGASTGSNPQSTESRLKTLIAAQPESPPLNFALGNLYSRQNRWAEAQQAYFNAVAGDGDNPDYLFNLAVSLDHLRQGRLAAQHYRLALDASERRPAAFDGAQVRRRLAELQP